MASGSLAEQVALIEDGLGRKSFCSRPGCTKRCTFYFRRRGAQPKFCSERCRVRCHTERSRLQSARDGLEIAQSEYRGSALASREGAELVARSERAMRLINWHLARYPFVPEPDGGVTAPRTDRTRTLDETVPPLCIVKRMRGEPLTLEELGELEAYDILRRRSELKRAWPPLASGPLAAHVPPSP